MMFGRKKAQRENDLLQQEVLSLRQVRDRLDREMLSLTLSASGEVIKVNSLFLDELGLKEETVLGKKMVDLVPEDLRDTTHFALMKDSIAAGKHWSGALQVARENSSNAWLRAIIQPVKMLDGSIDYISVHANNLTRTIESSIEHENLIKALQRSTAVVEFDLEGLFITANDKFLKSMGYTKEQLKGKHHRMFCLQEDADSEDYQAFWEKLKRGEFVAGRFQRLDSRGETVWLEASYNPISNAHGQFYKVVKFASVVTDQVNQELSIGHAAKLAYETSKVTDETAINGSRIIKETVSVMQELADQMTSVSQGISDLDEQSEKVGNIIKSIGDIADQTNLLALNAAIEAARAGEYGRGFAVVADEVRLLASRTTKATEEIVDVVLRNQELAKNAVGMVESGRQQAERGLALAGEAGEVIIDIQKGAKEVVGAVSKFANYIKP
ncbi:MULTISPECIES: methyl-accepting chemotaxis protein [unclassified Marinomonas]|jgi:methyl-accepting chemotaxis protein|uniref:methyl-accepting chemotaxis protein n=1 Tax=unclassified Marinomonas TaxID=196814 RepID=UPI0037C5A633